jgi:hypothetical protein
MTKWYVTMTDIFMSGWGEAKGRINKLVFECDGLEEAERVMKYAGSRTDQIYINLRNKKPYYPEKSYKVQYKTKAECPRWYE